MEKILNSGIYCLYFEELYGKYYIGYSTNLSGRYAKHCSMLRLETHHNYKLQQAYALYGFPTFDVMELCNHSDLVEKEQYYIKLFEAFSVGLNCSNGGEGCGTGESHVLAKYTQEEYISVFKDIVVGKLSLKDISEIHSVSYMVVRDISCGKTHAYLKDLFPEEYSVMLSNSGSRTGNLYKEEIYIKVLETLAHTTLSMREVSNKLDISYSVVRNLAYGTNHKYLQVSHSELYNLIKNKNRKNIGGKWITQ